MRNFKWWDELTEQEQSEYKRGVCQFDRGKEAVRYKFISEDSIEIYYAWDFNLPPAFTHYKSLVVGESGLEQ